MGIWQRAPVVEPLLAPRLVLGLVRVVVYPFPADARICIGSVQGSVAGLSVVTRDPINSARELICCPASDTVLAPLAVDVVQTEPEIGRFLVPSMCVFEAAIEAVVVVLALGRDLEAQALGVGGA